MTISDTPATRIRRADERGRTQLDWLDSWHSFSFGGYQDAAWMGFGPLRVINDDIIQPGEGFGEHGHRDMEILSWMLEGALRHGDNLGHSQALRPGELQGMTAGRGIRHSEFNASDADPAHLLQIWLLPRARGAEPRYDQRAFSEEGRRDRWQLLATGFGVPTVDADEPMAIESDAAVWVARLSPGASLPTATEHGERGYLHVGEGTVRIDGQTLTGGDALLMDEPGRVTVEGVEQATLLWFDLG